MTRNYIVLFLLILLITSSLFIGMAGPHGVIVNRALEKQLDEEQHRLDVQMLKLENLKRRMADVWTEESLLDSARSIGYVQSGESVYFFFNEDGKPLDAHQGNSFTVDIASIINRSEQDTVKGISLVASLGVSVAVSFILVMGIALRRNRKEKSRNITFNPTPNNHGS